VAAIRAGLDRLNHGLRQPDRDSDYKSWRIVDSITWQVGAIGGQAMAMYENDEAPGGMSLDATSVGGRVSYAVTKNLKLLAELGWSQRKPDNGESQHLTKITIGPALSTGPDFWKRPELRLYVTYADFNEAAANDSATACLRQDQRHVVRRAVESGSEK
jgi:maltoporin